ncbi:cytosine deaminase [Leptothoe kymatousa]|uniref:Cytosine deaminase n=1 Tax=Leptothoe kymatousa TAU-MAC 1615 TaxID=2364775 RepID=A0ABS5Y1H5_9CYAN|nr:cytosine deaminase [Leptothoe kymatousa]MBT9311640.1 cytosine deaminase [Leptothoe kymatousa TAU-MAC 1615]
MINSFVRVPDERHYWLTNGRIPSCFLTQETTLPPISSLQRFPHQEDLVEVNVEIKAGVISSITDLSTTPPPDRPKINLGQGLIWPCFVDMHTHLDKGHTWPRSPNPDGTFMGALNSVYQDHHHWNHEELLHRMEFGLKCSYAHGTQAIRTHLDSFGELGRINFEVFDELRRRWRDLIHLQAVCLVSLEYFLTPAAEALAQLVAQFQGVLGGVAYMNEHLVDQLDQAFTLAKRYGLNLDFHTDESLNPEDMTLRYVAEAALRHDFQGDITCGHCCSLSVQSPDTVETTLALVKAANIGIVSLPSCNLYLQDRQPTQTPRYRGVTLLHEIHQREISVAVASDNCRDPFYAYGDHDGLDVFKQAVRIGHLDRPFGHWPRSLTSRPANLMGLPHLGTVTPGTSADLICFKARTLNELVARTQSDRVIIRQGKQIDTTLPDYQELDMLF